jgi:DNA topoisomerase-2
LKNKYNILYIYQKQLLTLSNKARYILAILNDELDLRRKKYTQVVDLLKSMSYDLINDSYDYLIKMPMDSVTDENISKIIKERDNKQGELEGIMNNTIHLVLINIGVLLKESILLMNQIHKVDLPPTYWYVMIC